MEEVNSSGRERDRGAGIFEHAHFVFRPPGETVINCPKVSDPNNQVEVSGDWGSFLSPDVMMASPAGFLGAPDCYLGSPEKIMKRADFCLLLSHL